MSFMMKYLGIMTVLLSVFISGDLIFSQTQSNVRVSASNLFRYGNGKINSVTGDSEKEYFEELGDVRLFVNDFLFGARFEFDDPIEYGKGTKGISRRFFEFNKYDFVVRAGNYYELFSKGLTLNLFENRPLGFNTEGDGVNISYKHTFGKNMRFNGTILGGDIDYSDINDTSRTESYGVRAGNLAFTPLKFLTFGGSYLFADGDIPIQNTFTNINTEIFEGNIGLNYGDIDLFVTYANRVTISEPNTFYTESQAPRGDGGYGSLNFTKGGLGVTIDYKNYRFNLVTPNERSTSNPFKPLPFQNAPTCIKEYSSTLLSRFPHNPDFGDEVGYQIDVFYSPNDKLTFNGNFSLTSRHYDYKDIDTTAKTRYERVDRGAAWLPGLDDELSPYWEIFVEAEYYYNNIDKIKVGLSRKTAIVYSNIDPNSSEKIRSFTIPVEAQYTFAKIYNLKLLAEFQSAYNNLRSEGENDYFSQYTSLSVSRSPNVVLTGNLELTNDKEDPSGKDRWANVELTYRFTSANTVTLSYGSERGGIKCSSGICRYVNPFNGFRLTVINNIN